MSEEPGCSMKP